MENKNTYSVDFWKKYDWSRITSKPSTFSQFCLPYIKQGESLLDVCNGNGRDSAYFKENGMNVYAFDYNTLDLKDKKPKFDLFQTSPNP